MLIRCRDFKQGELILVKYRGILMNYICSTATPSHGWTSNYMKWMENKNEIFYFFNTYGNDSIAFAKNICILRKITA